MNNADQPAMNTASSPQQHRRQTQRHQQGNQIKQQDAQRLVHPHRDLGNPVRQGAGKLVADEPMGVLLQVGKHHVGYRPALQRQHVNVAPGRRAGEQHLAHQQQGKGRQRPAQHLEGVFGVQPVTDRASDLPQPPWNQDRAHHSRDLQQQNRDVPALEVANEKSDEGRRRGRQIFHPPAE
jgi:hypothetical protein